MWRDCALILVATRVAFLLIAYLAMLWFTRRAGTTTEGFLEIWARWDASDHFFRVAEDGYTGSEADPLGTAFFPLFPLLLRALSATGLSLVASGMIISAICSLIAFVYLYRLAEEEHSAGSGRRAVLYLALFPTAAFLVAPYSEALFLAGAIPAFYYARRGRWHLVALPAAVATGARSAGLFLLLALACELLRQSDLSLRKVARAGVALLVGAIPAIAYAIYLQVVKGSFLYYLAVQRQGWGREFTNPIQALSTTLDAWTRTDFPPELRTNFQIAFRLEVLAVVAGVALFAWTLKRREWGYAAFVGAMMLALMTSTWYFSVPRMLLTLFPAVLFLVELTLRSRRRHALVLVAFALTSSAGVITYTRGFWFF
ncbi:MAG: mannosyltransferase family protein [Actinomycetota bacterium]